jgi:hypothetical protein
MHDNPCRGVWRLAASPVDYLHSSAKFYLTGEQGIYPVTNSGELKDIDLTIKAIVRKSVELRYTRSPRSGRLRCEGIIGNGKRFMAYEMIRRLNEKKEVELLDKLAQAVKKRDEKRGKLHEVFEQSFDWKECSSDRFIDQKLDYMHDNPCRGVWRLAASPVDYLHSSAKFYFTGDQGIYPVTNSGELKDIDLTIKAIVRKSVE